MSSEMMLRSIESLDSLMTQDILARAVSLARAGNYQASEKLISGLLELDPENDFAWDLQARIHAQQGNLVVAERCWKEALKRNPEKPEYQQGLERIRKSLLPQRRWSLTGLVNLIMILCLIGAGWFMLDYRMNLMEKSQQAQLAVLRESLRNISLQDTASHPAVSVANENDESSVQKKYHETVSNAILGSLKDVSPEIRIDSSQPDRLDISFKNGIFTRGTQLSDTGQRLLLAIMEAIRPYDEMIHIGIKGSSDPLPMREESRYRDNDHLEYSRAIVAATFIVDTVNPPPGNIRIITTDLTGSSKPDEVGAVNQKRSVWISLFLQ